MIPEITSFLAVLPNYSPQKRDVKKNRHITYLSILNSCNKNGCYRYKLVQKKKRKNNIIQIAINKPMTEQKTEKN